MKRSDYRFTTEDEETMRRAMIADVASWRWFPDSDITRGRLVRIGAHSIGCTLADLRPVERDWLETEAGEVLR